MYELTFIELLIVSLGIVMYGEESVVCHNCKSSVCVIQDMTESSFLFFNHLKFDFKKYITIIINKFIYNTMVYNVLQKSSSDYEPI